MSTATATQPVLNRVIKLTKYRGYVARPIQTGAKGQVYCELTNFDTNHQVTDWIASSNLEEIVPLEEGIMCKIDGGECKDFFAQIISHSPDDPMYVGSAYCLVVSSSGRKRPTWIDDEYLRPCRQLKVKSGEYTAISTVTVDGTLLDIERQGKAIASHQTGKFFPTNAEAKIREVLIEFIDEIESTPQNSVTEDTGEKEHAIVPEESVEPLSQNSVAQVEELHENADYIEEPVEDDIVEEAHTPTVEPKTSQENKVVQLFGPRNSVTQDEVKETEVATEGVEEDKKNPPDSESMGMPEAEAEEEDWIYLSSEAEDRAEAIASKLIQISEPYVRSVTDFLWELKFVVFEDERRKKSQTYGTFEQMCRHLHEECNFPFHPNTAREKANAEQQRRLLRQAGVDIEVEKMSDSAALELNKIDSLKAEPEVILEAKRKVIGNATGLTRDAIASSIQQLSKDEDWENQYKFRYGKPKKKDKGEKPEPISRRELEEVQDRNTRLRKENETLREELQATKEELGYLREDYKEKEKNETFLSNMLQTTQAQLDEKDREIEQLKRELEEVRRRGAILAG